MAKLKFDLKKIQLLNRDFNIFIRNLKKFIKNINLVIDKLKIDIKMAFKIEKRVELSETLNPRFRRIAICTQF